MHSASDAVVEDAIIGVRDLTMAFGDTVVQQDIAFDVARGSIFGIIGGSGCGKSTLLRHLIGLETAATGDIRSRGHAGGAPRFGVLFQNGALWSSMTLAQNIETVLALEHRLDRHTARELAYYQLALVGLADAARMYPAQISGGMRKRAALARAMALDPELLFLDEPSAGLDPLSSRSLDTLILQLRDTLGTSVVIVTHELQSIFSIVDTAIFLDARSKRPAAIGSPQWLASSCPDPHVREFLAGPTAEARDA